MPKGPASPEAALQRSLPEVSNIPLLPARGKTTRGEDFVQRTYSQIAEDIKLCRDAYDGVGAVDMHKYVIHQLDLMLDAAKHEKVGYKVQLEIIAARSRASAQLLAYEVGMAKAFALAGEKQTPILGGGMGFHSAVDAEDDEEDGEATESPAAD